MRSERKTQPIAQLRALVVMAGALVFASHVGAEKRDYVTVCEITADSGKFVSKFVWVRDAMLQSNATDITTLQDARCPGIQHVVTVLITSDPKKKSELKKFISVLTDLDSYGTYGKEVRGNFFGRIQMSGFLHVRTPAIVVERVENLSVRRAIAPK